MNENSNI